MNLISESWKDNINTPIIRRNIANNGLSPSGELNINDFKIFEVIAQTSPYSGFPPALNALQIAEDVFS